MLRSCEVSTTASSYQAFRNTLSRTSSWPRPCTTAVRKAMGHIVTPRNLILALTLVLLTASLRVTLRGGTQDQHLDSVDAKGNIRRPPEYRDRYQVLGAYVVLDPTSMVADAPRSNADELHYTYASPGTAELFRKNRRLADGTVPVKEVLATSQAQLTTGDAH